MAESKRFQVREMTAGDAAVDGLLGGLGGGIVMGIYLLGVSLLMGESPLVMLARFAADTQGPTSGALMHLAVSAVYGTLFGLIWSVIGRRWPDKPTVVAGVVYGLLLWLMANTLLLPGSASSLQQIPSPHFAIAHLLYGLTLGYSLHHMWTDDD
ncbi:MAG: DUF1440 domain-containing protein [Chloroflexota bacterium]|nr:DUF1440 domain-containing protein [Chloroflexota bacterium]